MLAFALVGIGLLIAITSSAYAGPTCTDSWKAAVDGSWTDGSNWDKGVAPTSTDVACIQQPGKYTVTLTGAASVKDLRARRGQRY